jgi:hypothetical protein
LAVVSTVVFKAELAFQGAVDRFDESADRAELGCRSGSFAAAGGTVQRMSTAGRAVSGCRRR